MHDTLRRPGLPDPDLPAPPDLPIRLGFADESFSVYDHPVVLVLENMARYDASAIISRIERASAARVEASRAPPGPLLTANESEAQRPGGTWSEIFRPGSLTAAWPIVAWLVLVQGVALLTLPIAFVVLSPLADRGYLLAKPLGLLLLGLAVWLLASLRWMPFSAGSIALCLAALCAVSTGVLVKRRTEIGEMLRTHWKPLLVARGRLPGGVPGVRGAAHGEPGPVAPVPGRGEAHGLRLPQRRGPVVVHATLRSMVRRRLHQLLLLGAVPGRYPGQGHVHRHSHSLQPSPSRRSSP